ncbi:MAG: hypothetical protein IMZ55_04595 [Acidobacteria bacterium]|nr:hypothetical protein [Acidobacteriota bacterium]
MNWKTILRILETILPLILAALASASDDSPHKIAAVAADKVTAPKAA